MAKFLDRDGLQYFTARLKEVIDQATQLNIITAIDENSTNQQLPGAKAVYELLQDMLEDVAGLSYEVVTSLPATGEANVIYLVEFDDDTYTMYIYSGGKWFDIGTTELDLSDYWAKDDLTALTNPEIQEVIDDVMGD